MLTKFTVENFKIIKNVTVDFASAPSNDGYDFNTEAVKNGIVTKAMLYGKTGVGKSTLCEALLNITAHIHTGRLLHIVEELYMTCSFNNNTQQHYIYEFKFGDKTVKYDYTKTVSGRISSENLYVDDRLVVERVLVTSPFPPEESDENFKVYINGTENVKWKKIANFSHKYSLVQAVMDIKSDSPYKAIIANDPDYETLKAFYDFVCNMRCVGIQPSSPFHSVTDSYFPSCTIIQQKQSSGFSEFLQACGFKGYGVDTKTIPNFNSASMVKLTLTTPYSDVPEAFDSIASSGLKELAVYYSAYITVASSGSFLVIDDFGDGLSLGVGKACVKLFRGATDKQILLISNNTDLISNDLLRPDCYFNITEKKGNVTIKSFRNSTRKDIRFEHNLQKMYKADFFD